MFIVFLLPFTYCDIGSSIALSHHDVTFTEHWETSGDERWAWGSGVLDFPNDAGPAEALHQRSQDIWR